MNTYGYEEMNPNQQPAQPAQPESVPQEQPAPAAQQPQFQTRPEGYYAFAAVPGEGYYYVPAPKVKKKINWKPMKRAVACVLLAVLLVGSCTATALITNSLWRDYMKDVTLSYEEKLDVMQEKFENKVDSLGGEAFAPVEGLTPAQLYQQNLKSVVAISCKTVTNSFGQSYVSTSSGSGFVLSEDGYVVTNHHVIEEATEIVVVTAGEEEYVAELIGSDASNDIALLKIQATGLQAAVIGNSDALAVGSQVVAIGNALGELGSSLTVGYISGKDREVTTDGSIINMLQTDAAINPGNSGGPLFNMNGEVVGITTAKYSGSTSSGATIEGIGFAIPINDVIGMLEDLRQFGYITGVQMGVMVRNMDPSVAEAYGFPMGVYVDSVVGGSCAEKAGIRSKDIITEVGGYEIETMNDLTRALRKFQAGQEATVKVWRGGREVLLTIVFDAKAPA